MSQKVIFLHGPAAAGKHTIGSIVAERLGWPLWHNHLTVDLVSALFEFGSDAFVALRESIWLSTFACAAKAQRSFVFTFAPEATVRRSLIDELQGEIAHGGGDVHFIELVCAEAVVESRLANASRAAFGKLTDTAVYRQIKTAGGFQFPPMPAPLVTVDTEALQPDEAAAIIIAAVSKASAAP
ncbi:MAG: shikimate kinase [Pseudomonadota bacterium]